MVYTTLAWASKGVARCLTRILPRQYQDIVREIILSWESSLPMTLIPSQFKESMRFDLLVILSNIELCIVGLIFVVVAKLSS